MSVVPYIKIFDTLCFEIKEKSHGFTGKSSVCIFYISRSKFTKQCKNLHTFWRSFWNICVLSCLGTFSYCSIVFCSKSKSLLVFGYLLYLLVCVMWWVDVTVTWYKGWLLQLGISSRSTIAQLTVKSPTCKVFTDYMVRWWCRSRSILG